MKTDSQWYSGNFYRSIYLDRQLVGCPWRQAMNGFRLQPDYGPENMRFYLQCRGFSGVVGGASEFYTSGQDWCEGNTRCLARHNVQCPSGWVMQYWRLYRPTATTIAFRIGCVPASISWCQDLETNFDQAGGGGVNFLDRQFPICPGNSAMQRWQLVNDGWSEGASWYKIAYRCCHPT